MLFLKLLTIVFAITIIAHMVRLRTIGKALAQGDTSQLAAHRSTVACMGCVTAIMIVLIEAIVRINPTPSTAPWPLIAFHLTVDAALVVVFVIMVVRYTGLKKPEWHGKLAYSLYGLFGLAFASGSALLWQL